MAKKIALTPASIDALPKGLLADLLTPGLAIEVLASGKKRWRYRRQVDRTDRPRHGDSPIWKMRSFRTNYQGASARDTADRLYARNRPKRLCTFARLSMRRIVRSEEHTSELQSLMRISYAGFC